MQTRPERGERHTVYSLRAGRRPPIVGKGKPRGRGGGRPPVARVRAGGRAAEATTPADRARRLSADSAVVVARTRTRLENLRRAKALEAARVYRLAHTVGDRYRPHYVERIVYVQKPRRQSLSQETIHALGVCADDFMSEAEQGWLRALVRESGATSDGTLFVSDYVSRFADKFGRTLAPETIRKCMLAMGLAYVRLHSSYHKASAQDVKNLKRRQLVVPLLHYLHSYQRRVCVWNFDEASFYVQDFSGHAWVDTSLPDHQFRPYIMANNKKGKRLTVSAFVSARFGVLFDDMLQHHVGALNTETTDQATTVEMFRWFASVAAAKYPDYLHVVVTDSPGYHSMMPPDACDPGKINMSDGGANREADRLYGTKGLTSIFRTDPSLRNIDTSNFKKKDYQKALWSHAPVKEQLLWLEEVLLERGHLLLFHPVSHPELAPIELLWRDLKFAYRTKSAHTEKNLTEFLAKRLGRGDSDDNFLAQCSRYVAVGDTLVNVLGRIFSTARAFVGHYLSGGTTKISERQAKRAFEDHFSSYENGEATRRSNMRKYLYDRVAVPTTDNAKDAMPIHELRASLQKWTHELNWYRKKHALFEDADAAKPKKKKGRK